jgi:hypothetical protein
MSHSSRAQSDHIHNTISIEQCDFDLLQMVAQQRGLGETDLETTLQLILREWLEMQEELPGATFPTARIVDRLG